jgi:hypothetical protein
MIPHKINSNPKNRDQIWNIKKLKRGKINIYIYIYSLLKIKKNSNKKNRYEI